MRRAHLRSSIAATGLVMLCLPAVAGEGQPPYVIVSAFSRKPKTADWNHRIAIHGTLVWNSHEEQAHQETIHVLALEITKRGQEFHVNDLPVADGVVSAEGRFELRVPKGMLVEILADPIRVRQEQVLAVEAMDGLHVELNVTPVVLPDGGIPAQWRTADAGSPQGAQPVLR